MLRAEVVAKLLESVSHDRALHCQALRLVKESIIQVQSPDTEVDDVDFVDDLGEVEDVVARFRRAEQEGAAGNAATAVEQQPPLNSELDDTCADVKVCVSCSVGVWRFGVNRSSQRVVRQQLRRAQPCQHLLC